MSSRVREGTGDLRKVTQVGRGTGTPRKFRCQCGGMAQPSPDGKGGVALVCPGCKRQYINTPMD